MTELNYGINIEKKTKDGFRVRLFADAFSQTLDKYKQN